jgi:hypothetical protein
MILINKDKLVKLEHSFGKILNINSLYEVIICNFIYILVVPIDYMKKIYISCAELIE